MYCVMLSGTLKTQQMLQFPYIMIPVYAAFRLIRDRPIQSRSYKKASLELYYTNKMHPHNHIYLRLYDIQSLRTLELHTLTSL